MPRVCSFLAILLASATWAQSLALLGLPASERLGGRSGAVVVERRASDGTPLTTGNTSVTISADSPVAQVSTVAAPSGAWGPTVQVSISPGSSQSAPFYVRDGRPGATTWSATASGFMGATGVVTVRTDAVTCDVETGTVLDTELPPGAFNTRYAPYAQSSIGASMAAAHRGSFGVRLVDASGGTGDAADTALYEDGAPIFGAYHVRAWVRLAASNAVGEAIIVQLTNTETVSPSLLDLRVDMATQRIAVGGFIADAGYLLPAFADAGLSLGQWHLLEVLVSGAGTADGGRAAWLDGQPLVSSAHLDFSGSRMSVGRLAIGQPYAPDRRWQGTLDFDDLRSGAVPMASLLRLEAAPAAFVGECVPLTVSLVSTVTAQPTPTAEPATLELLAGVGTGLFTDAQCQVPGTSLVLPPGATSVGFSARPVRAVEELKVRTDDFVAAARLYSFDEAPVLVVSPAQATVAPGEVVDLIVSGGTGRGLGFLTSLPSGGSLVGPRYTAGSVTGVEDLITARDSSGATATARFAVRAADAGGAGDAGADDAGTTDAGTTDAGTTDAGTTDAGTTDAGATDAGTTDAGATDAGTTDAGTTDAGTTDAGADQPQRLTVGCGCAAIPGDGLGLLVLALAGGPLCSRRRSRRAPLLR